MTSENLSWSTPLTVGACGVRGDGTWWWSAPVYRLLGLTPGEVVPTAAALLAHVRPGDRPSVRTLLAADVPGGTDAAADVHDARLVHVVRFDGDEQMVLLHMERGADETRLWLVELGEPYGEAVRHGANRQLLQALGSRSVIDRAKGVLAAVRGDTDDEAFDVLRAASQIHNVRLRAVAEQVVAAATPHRLGLEQRLEEILGIPRDRAADAAGRPAAGISPGG